MSGITWLVRNDVKMVCRTIRMSNRDILVHATPLHLQSSFHTVKDRENEVGWRTFIQRDENRAGREDFTITVLPDLHLSQSGDPVEHRVRHEMLAWRVEAILLALRQATSLRGGRSASGL